MSKKSSTKASTPALDVETKDAVRASIEIVRGTKLTDYKWNAIDPRKLPAYNPEKSISANPSELLFPTDKWGLTRDLKKAMIIIASRLAGHEDKMELYKEILGILTQHVQAKHEETMRRKNGG